MPGRLCVPILFFALPPQLLQADEIITVAVDDIRPTGPSTDLVRLAIGDDLLLPQVTRLSLTRLDLIRGDPVFAPVQSVTVRR